MKIRLIALGIILLHSLLSGAQPVIPLTLDTCQKLALSHQTLTRKMGLYRQMHELEVETLNKQLLPGLSLSGQASWQSEVTELPIHLPSIDIPSMDKDSYKANLEINQLIWDGGILNRQKKMENVLLLLNLGAVEIEQYNLRSRVNQVFFSILLANENEKLLKTAMEEIGARLSRVRAGVENGAILPANASVLDAELINTEQTLAGLVHNRAADIYQLAELTGLELSPDVILTEPVYDDLPAINTRLRPEYRLLVTQQQQLGLKQEMSKLDIIPRLSAFGLLGYGKPGLNMLSDEFNPYAMVGVRLSWKLWDWKQHQKHHDILGLQSQVVDMRKETYEQDLRIMLQRIKQDIVKLETLIAADHRIISLRKSVAESAAVQLDQGLITSSDYLTEQNAYIRAQLNLQLHHIQLQHARTLYLTTMGYAQH
ncbi:TolC family protein [Lentimicrobium sp.]